MRSDSMSSQEEALLSVQAGEIKGLRLSYLIVLGNSTIHRTSKHGAGP